MRDLDEVVLLCDFFGIKIGARMNVDLVGR